MLFTINKVENYLEYYRKEGKKWKANIKMR